MRWRSFLWFCVSVLCFVAAAYFWRLGNRWAAEKASTPATTPTAHGNTNAGTRTHSAPVTLLSAAGILNSPKAISALEANSALVRSNRLSLQLRNTTNSLAQLRRNDKALLLENASLDTAQPMPFIPAHLKAQGDPGAYIVKARGNIDKSFYAALEQAGAQYVSFVPNNSALVRADASTAASVASLAQVEQVLPYEPYYKVKASLLKTAVEQKALPKDAALNVLVFSGAREQTIQDIQALGAVILGEDRSPFGPAFKILPTANSLVQLANLSGVQEIEMASSRILANDLSRAQIQVAADTIVPTNNMGLTGNGVMVAVVDSGVDTNHPDLQPRVVLDPTLDPLGLGGYDTSGHGTHVAGIIASSGGQSLTVTNASGSIMPPVAGQFRGKAPAANLYSLPLFLPDFDLQQAVAQTNVFISNNGWTYGSRDYDLAAASYDAAVRDSLPLTSGSQPILYVFPAGNSGDGSLNELHTGSNDGTGGSEDTILSPATAKNVITVGAVEQLRNITNEVAKCILGVCQTNTPWKDISDSSNQVAGFSSRGNVGYGIEGDSGRFKPDLVAPGVFDVSTRSTTWDEAAYYNPTSHITYSFPDLLLDTNANFANSVFYPYNAVHVDMFVYPNAVSPIPFPGMPIYIRQADFPDYTTYDFIVTNTASMPSNGVPVPGQDFFYMIANTSTQAVSFNVLIDITVTNELGNYFEVLSNLNNQLGPYYRYESGSSMAAAQVSGTLALMQEFFQQQLHVTNSPAMMKALLINGARSLGDPYNFLVRAGINYEGWGMVELTNSARSILAAGINSGPSSMFMFDQSATNALATGWSQTRFFSTSTPIVRSQPLRVTLAWTDPPGNPVAGFKLVNDLDLIVTNLDSGEVFVGNNILGGDVFTSAWDTNTIVDFSNVVDVATLDSIQDRVNNVENVYLAPTLGNNYSVTVNAHRVNVNAVPAHTNEIVQDFALVISAGDGRFSDALTLTGPPTMGYARSGADGITNSFSANSPSPDPDRSGGILQHQRVGANSPLTGTNTVNPPYNYGNVYVDGKAILPAGNSNQWHFYQITNSFNFTNATFMTLLANNLALPRMGVTDVGNPDNATRVEADIDLYVSTNPDLLNLETNAVFSAYKSLGRLGTESVILSNAIPGGVYYIGVKSEDQMAAEFTLFAMFSLLPLSQSDQQGNQTLNYGPVFIPDGTPEHPGVAQMILPSMDVLLRRVTVTNTITHELMGDLQGTLTHAGDRAFAVLNNHSPNNAVINQTYIYDDSGDNDIPGSIHSAGPGSLHDFAGTHSGSIWQFTQVDNSHNHVGTNDHLKIFLEKQQPLTNGITLSLCPGDCREEFVEIPANVTNMTIAIAFQTGNGPCGVQICRLGSTSGCLSNAVSTPGGVVSIDSFDNPPLKAPATYSIRFCNLGVDCFKIHVLAIFYYNTAQRLFTSVTSTNAVSISDDAVTYATMDVTNHLTIQSMDIGMLINHLRISDLAITLVSPSGTRVLLFEDRGAASTNGLGTFSTFTNGLGTPGFSYTNMAPFYTNNFDDVPVGRYAPGAIFDGWNVLTNFATIFPLMPAPWLSNNVLILNDSVVSNTLPTTNSTAYSLSFNVTHAPYLVGTVSWWPLDGRSVDPLSANTRDIFGGHDGMLSGDVTFSAGEVANAYFGDGVATRMMVPACSDLDLGARKGFTIEGWINPQMPVVNSTNAGDAVYVSSPGNNTIQRYQAGVSSVFASGLNAPSGLAFDAAGNLYVSNAGDNTILKITPAGTRSVFAGTGLNNPQGLAFDSAGNLYVANISGNTIWRYTPAGAGSFFANAAQPAGLAFDAAGNLFVTTAGSTITKITPAGASSLFANTGPAPGGLAFDGAGNLYTGCGDNDTVQKFTPAGTGSVFANTLLSGPLGLTFGSGGTLYVVNNHNNTVTTYGPTGSGSLYANTGVSSPRFIAVTQQSSSGSIVWSNSFENEPRQFINAPGYFCQGWSVNFGDIERQANGAFGNPGLADSGSYYIDINGHSSCSISTNIALAPGTYKLSFAYSRNPDSVNQRVVPLAEVNLNGATVAFLAPALTNSWSVLGWQTTSLVFTASSSPLNLEVRSMSPGLSGVIFDSFAITTSGNATNVGLISTPIAEWNDLTATNGMQQGVQFWLSGLPISNGIPGSLWVNLWDTNSQMHVMNLATNAITNGGWQHIAFTYDAATLTGRVYTNGQLGAVQPMSLTNFVPRTTGDFYLGFHTEGPTNFTAYNGGLDEFGAYNRALTDCELLAIYSAGPGGKYGTNILWCPLTNTPTRSSVEVQLLTTTGNYLFPFTNGFSWKTNGIIWETNTFTFTNSLLSAYTNGPGTNLAAMILTNADPNTVVDEFVLSALTTNFTDGLMHFTENTDTERYDPIKFAPWPYNLSNSPPALVYSNEFELATNGVYQTGSVIFGTTNADSSGGIFTNIWNVLEGPVAVISNSWIDATGTNCLALAGGTVAATLPTVPGHRYQFTYDIRGPGAVSWWSGDVEPLSRRAWDLLGGNNGAFIGYATNSPQSFVRSQALYFNGRDPQGLGSKIEVADPANLRLSNGFTIEGWIQPVRQTNYFGTEQLVFRGDARDCLDPYYLALEPFGLDQRDLHFHIEDESGLACGVDVFTTNGPIALGSGPNNGWWHVAAVFDKPFTNFTQVIGTNSFVITSNALRLYINGACVATNYTRTSPFRDLDAAYSGGVSLGNRSRDDYSQPYRGFMDEMSVYGRALSEPELTNIFLMGAQGKADLSVPASRSLAKAAISIDSVLVETGYGENGFWTARSVFFTATTSNSVVTIHSLEPGTILDGITLTEIPQELHYNPEVDLSAFNGEDAFGTWKLEMWDTRTGAALNNPSLIQWVLNFVFTPPSPPPLIYLSHGIPYTNTIAANSAQYFVVNVPQWATIATNILQFVTDRGGNPLNVGLLSDTNGLPTSLTNALLWPPVNGGMTNLSTNSMPPVPSGQPYYLAVTNPNPVAASFVIGVWFDITSLVNCQSQSNYVRQAGIPRYFQFPVPTSDPAPFPPKEVSLYLTGAGTNSVGYCSNVTVVLSQHLPLPDLTHYDYILRNTCTNDGALLVLSNTTPFPVTTNVWTVGVQSNMWYVGVFNNGASNVSFNVEACYATNFPTTILLTNGIPYNVSSSTNPFSAPPGPPRWFFFEFQITNYVDGVLFELYNLSGDADLVLQRNVPPTSWPYFDGSFRLGNSPEQIVLHTTRDLPDLRGNWYLGVYNNEITNSVIGGTNLTYSIRAVTEANGLLVSAQPIRLNLTRLAPPHGLVVSWNSVIGEHYFVQYSAGFPVNWTTIGEVKATTPLSTFEVVPIPSSGAGLYRVVQSLALTPPPKLQIQLWTNNLVRLSWSTNNPGETLQYSTTFSGPWLNLNKPVVVEGVQYAVYDNIQPTPRYYRLIP